MSGARPMVIVGEYRVEASQTCSCSSTICYGKLSLIENALNESLDVLIT